MARFTRIGENRRNKKKKLILFISTGDTCRAPMAAGYFKKILENANIDHIEVRDAGILTVPGLRATAEAIQVLDTVDVDLRKHSSHKLSNEIIKRADLILGMSSLHVQTALRQSDIAKEKTRLLKEYIDWEQKNVQISDPMGGTLEVYKKCFGEIKESCDRLINKPFVMSMTADIEGNEIEQPKPETRKTIKPQKAPSQPKKPTPKADAPELPPTAPAEEAATKKPPKHTEDVSKKKTAKKAAKNTEDAPAKKTAKKAAKNTEDAPAKKTAEKAAKNTEDAPAKKTAKKAAKKAPKKTEAKATEKAPQAAKSSASSQSKASKKK